MFLEPKRFRKSDATQQERDNFVTVRLRAGALGRIAAALAIFFALPYGFAADQSGHSVPLFDDGVIIRVPVKVLGQTLYFLVDSGFTVSSIDAKYAAALGAPVGACSIESPLGMKTSLPLYHCPEMSIGGKPVTLDRIAGLDLTMARRISGQPCDGILGLDFFAQGVVTLDFERKLVSLYDETPDRIKKTAVAVPLEPSEQRFSVRAVVNQIHSLKLMVDTGDNSSLSLNPESWQTVFSTSRAGEIIATIAGVGNQVTQSKVAGVRRLSIQGLDYTNLHATFIRNTNDLSHLGLGFFRRHKVTFDFPGEKLYLQPGSEFSVPDQENMSGLHLLREHGEVTVHSVDENSPAYNQGVRPGDIIVAVNSQDATSLALSAIRCVFQSQDGAEVGLDIRRGGGLLKVRFKLKKTL